jgi:hypothetical protein
MRTASTFTLQIEPATQAMPPRVSNALSNGGMPISPAFMTLEELESAINTLQDELDVLRADARRAFDVTAGHA